jgi:hypothetical protein
MEVTKEAVDDLLNSLVKPMFNGIKKIDVTDLSLFDDPNILYPTIDVIFDKDLYYSYDDTPDELEYKVSKEVKSALKYFNINNSIVDFYTITDI